MKKLLPTGTVVYIKQLENKTVIYDRFQQQLDSDDETVYDYAGCPYSRESLSPAMSVVFNHEDITEICFMGYQNIEEMKYRNHIAKEYEKEKHSNKRTRRK